jgi:TPR repeat protein
MRAAYVFVGAIVLAACGKHRSSSEGQPAPSSSVITLGIELGTCPDVPACERECDAGSSDRCRRLAMSYAFGKGVDKDETKATELLVRACDMGDPSSCVFAGQSYEYEHGVPKDFAKAARFYEKGCDLKWAPGCYNLAIMYERGTGVPMDRQKAADLYQFACTAGASQACDKAKEMHAPPALPFLDGGFP